jgi:uncharacterized protein (DUF2147 family)
VLGGSPELRDKDMRNLERVRQSAKSGKARVSCAAVAGMLLLTAPALADPTGQWLVAKRYAKIDIVKCDRLYWGIVTWESRVGGVDRNNPDPAKRMRPTVGMPILLAMRQTERNRWEGKIYNSEDGKTYSSNISLLDRDTLKVQGCVMGFLCGGENWTRVKPDPRTAMSSSTGSGAANAGGRSLATTSTQDTAAARSQELCSRVDGVSRPAH